MQSSNLQLKQSISQTFDIFTHPFKSHSDNRQDYPAKRYTHQAEPQARLSSEWGGGSL